MYPIRHNARNYLPGEPGTPSPQSPVVCEFCNTECVPTSPTIPDYAVLLEQPNNRQVKICYTCAAKVERDAMTATGRATLYQFGRNESRTFTDHKGRTTYGYTHIGNWTGDLKFPIKWQTRSWCLGFGGGGMYRNDYNFIGPDGFVWYGRNQGNGDIVHCKRTKQCAEPTRKTVSA